MNKKQIEEARQIASDLTVIKARLGALGMFKTMHALGAATNAIGYELAERCEALGLISDGEKRRRKHNAIHYPKEHARETRRLTQ